MTTKTKELETLLINAADTLVKMRTALKLSSAKNNTALNELLSTPEAKLVFKWRRARRLALKDVDTVPAKVVTSSTRKPKTDKRPVEARTVKGAPAKMMIGKTIQVRTKQFTIKEVFLLDVQGQRAVLLDNGYVYSVTDIEKTPEGKSDYSIKKGVLRIRGVKPPVATAEKESKATRTARQAKEMKVVGKVASAHAARALAKAEKDLEPKSAKEASKTARTRRSGKDGVKKAADKAVREGFNANRARNSGKNATVKKTTGKKTIKRG